MTEHGGFLAPFVDEDGGPFWEGARQGELRVQRCGSCGRLRFPPRPMCPWCRSVQAAWPAMSGKGSIWSFVVAHPPLLPAYAAVAPYNVTVVALDEDPLVRLVGNLVTGPDGGIGEIDPAAVEIGARVRVVFSEVAEGIIAPRWVLDREK